MRARLLAGGDSTAETLSEADRFPEQESVVVVVVVVVGEEEEEEEEEVPNAPARGLLAPSLRDSTWLHEPGAAQRSTARTTPLNRSNVSSSCNSLKAERARNPTSLALR